MDFEKLIKTELFEEKWRNYPTDEGNAPSCNGIFMPLDKYSTLW